MIREVKASFLKNPILTPWHNSNAQQRHFQGDYTMAFLALAFQMECQVRALQIKNPYDKANNSRGIFVYICLDIDIQTIHHELQRRTMSLYIVLSIYHTHKSTM